MSFTAIAQTNITEQYFKADSLLLSGRLPEAYNIYKEILPKIDKNDTLYNYVVWYFVQVTSILEDDRQLHEDYTNSLKYSLEALKLIQDNKENFDKEFADREPWMVKNVIVAYFGLEKLDEAKKYRDILYKGYKERNLPDVINEYFNFDFFKVGDKNVWGYEWYPELPDDRVSTSFTKIVYYVYSTKPDGTDNEQLYRLHVLMFHQDKKETEFDYILEKQQDVDNSKVCGSYYSCTYKKEIDYKKLRKDIKEIVKNNTQPDTKRITTWKK